MAVHLRSKLALASTLLAAACGGGSKHAPDAAGASDARPPSDAPPSDATPPSDAMPPHHTTYTTFEPASLVIGQADFAGGDRGDGAGGVYLPFGAAAWDGATFWIPDTGNNRVLGEAGFPAHDQPPATLVIGQASVDTTVTATTATGLDTPVGVRAAGGHLYVDDAGNSRILVFDAPPTTSGAAASFAIGQSDLTEGDTTCDAMHLDDPGDFVVAGNRLVVADTGHNRVLVWNSIPTTFGVAPDLVLGQGDFTHCVENDDAQNGNFGLPTARTMHSPRGVWTDGTRLIVTDTYNNRVLVWNTFPTTAFAPADFVLGQADGTTNDEHAGVDGFFSPELVDSDGTQLAIGDEDNNRVLVWTTIPTSNVGADVVLGQSTFDHVTRNDDDQDDFSDATASARTLSLPTGLAFIRDTLVVTDQGNHRYLVFGDLPCPTGQYETPPGSGTCAPDPCVGACAGMLCDNSTGAAVCE